MESPVRLCIGAALVVNLLLLSGTLVNGIVLPHDTTPSPAHDRTLRYSRNNETSTFRNRAKFPDVSINELKPKDSTSEDHTEKNAKYKDRGRITYFSQLKSSTESPLRRIRTTELPKLKIITPTVEVKKPVNLVDSMNTYKRTELPIARSTIPVVVHKEQKSEEETYEDEEDEEEKDTFEKFSPSKFYNFFTIPSYNDGYDYTRESDSESSDKVKKNKNSPNYGSFSSFFPEENSYGYKDTTHDVFKSESFFSFDSDLTTPKNDFFDKKFQRISSSITKNLDDIKTKASPANATNIYKIVQEKVDMEKVGNNTPSNKSSVFIKNTKEIRLLDNDSASSANKELSDVQGTSIYYEMTVLSTETYGVHSDDDCDNESLSAEPTVGTSSEEELVLSKAKPTAIKAKPTIPIATKQTFTDSIYDFINPVAADLNPKNTKQAQPHAKSEIKIKTAYDKIKPTLPYLETDNYNPATWTEERGRIKSTVPNIHVDSFKTTSSSARQENKKSRSSVSAAGSKTLLSTLRSKSVRPILLNTSAEGTKSTIYETAKPTTNFRFKIENPTIPYPVFDSTINPIFPSPTFEAIKPTYPDKSSENESILSLDHILVSSVLPMFNSLNAIPVSTQNVVSSTERAKKIFLNNNTRNRTYSKRPNMNGNKDSPNSVTPKPEGSSTQSAKTYTRKYYHSITKPRPIWMPPRKNDTKSYAKPTYPTTIYSEHFSIKDKYKKMTTIRPKVPIKTVLTTISSDIDPVLEIDASGAKKVVHSQSLIDNTVPGLWKRGSTKFGTSASNSSVKETETELPIPPTSTMWALVSLLSIPHSPNITNGTKLPQKGVSENNLQEVVETMGEQEITTDSSAPTTANPINNDILVEKVTKLVQNKLSLQPMLDSKDQNSVTQTESQNEIHSETLPAESIISVQSSSDTATTEPIDVEQEKTASWMPDSIETEQISIFHSTKGFESITKLPSDVTTPLDETDADSEINESNMNKHLQTTTDYAITTIRFSYIPTEEIETETQSEEITPTTWHPVFPTRTKITYVKEIPITTYRPQYMTTTEMIDESTIVYETTPRVEVSSQVLENSAKIVPVTTAVNEVNTLLNTAEMTTQGTTSEVDTQQTSVKENTEQTTDLFSTELITTQASNTTPTTTTEVEDTTTIVVEVVTEINTEREQRIEPTTMLPETTEIPPNELHDTDCTEESSAEIITEGTLKTTITETTTAKDTTTHATETSMTATTAEEITTTNRTIEETTTAISTTEPTTKLATYRTTIEIIEGTTRIVIQENVPELSQSTSEFQTTSEYITEAPEITQPYGKIIDTTLPETTTDTNYVTKSVSELEDLTSYSTEVTTQASSIILNDENTGSGAAVAIAVSTIGVIALILLIGLLLVVRRRGRRGVYAQRCTPVSLDAYSLDSVSVGHRKGNQRLRASKRSYGNPAYDDEVTSHPMNYPALANFALDMESMTMEFSEIPSVTVKPDEVPPGCEDKNRYSNVLPLPETRVPLRRIGSDATTEYINANYVTGPGNIRNYYIACQAPLSSTVVDFWRMIWEQNSRLIVMLTEYMENGVEKCYEYLPPSEISDNRRTFGDFKIILKKREQHDKYAVSSVQLVNTTTRTWREITHLWYFWPAKGVPEDYDSVIDFLCEMRTFMKISQTAKEYDEEGVEVIYGDQSRSSFSNLSKLREEGVIGHGMNVYSPARAEEQMRRTMSNNGTLGRMKAASEVEGIRPCVVTCASGAGRSAAVIALDICARALPTSAGADVPRVVRHLRAQRPHSLTNRHHYIFIYKVLSEYGNKMLGGGGVDSI